MMLLPDWVPDLVFDGTVFLASPTQMIAKGERQVFATAEKRDLTGSSHKSLSRFPTESVLIEGAQGLLEMPFPRSEKKEEEFCPCRVFISLVKNSVSASLVAYSHGWLAHK